MSKKRILPDLLDAKTMTQQDWNDLRRAARVRSNWAGAKIANFQGKIEAATPSDNLDYGQRS